MTGPAWGQSQGSPIAPEQRTQRLQQAVQGAMARGGRIQSATDYSAVLTYGKPVNHVLHLLLSVVTAGLWLFVWLLITLTGGERREMMSVDLSGRVTAQKV